MFVQAKEFVMSERISSLTIYYYNNKNMVISIGTIVVASSYNLHFAATELKVIWSEFLSFVILHLFFSLPLRLNALDNRRAVLLHENNRDHKNKTTSNLLYTIRSISIWNWLTWKKHLQVMNQIEFNVFFFNFSRCFSATYLHAAHMKCFSVIFCTENYCIFHDRMARKFFFCSFMGNFRFHGSPYNLI